jgi:hypothetical protein
MTDAKQPEALRLADELDCASREDAPVHTAADELRRLHELNQELLEALKQLCAAQEKGHVADWAAVWDDAKAAIAKAEVTK